MIRKGNEREVLGELEPFRLVCGGGDVSSVGDNVAWDLLCSAHTGIRKTAELRIKLVG